MAIAYDFDGTLAPGNMQEHQFLPDIGMTPAAFWKEVHDTAKKHQADEVLVSPNAKGFKVVDSQGNSEAEDVDLAINRSSKHVNKSYEIYLSLYWVVSGTEEERNIYKQFSPDFFDLIVIDEYCS